MNKRFFALVVAFLFLFTGCGQTNAPAASSSETAPSDPAAYFSDRDLENDYDPSGAVAIALNGSSASCDYAGVSIEGSTITITTEGTYLLSGTLEDGQIIINTDKREKVQLVLDGVAISSSTSAPIYVLQSDKVFLTTTEGSSNTLSNAGSFTAIDENNIDAVIFSKEDLTLNGAGTLTITSPAGHGVVSKDSLTVSGGSYVISAASHGLDGKDDVCITNASFDIISGKDGIHAENDDDAALGYVYIHSGSFTISAEGDGISAEAYMTIDGGDFTITTGGGSANAANQTNENWGNFMGGDMGGPGGGMGRPDGGQGGPGGTMGPSPETPEATETVEDSTSIKAIKAGGDLTINAGTFILDSADDSVHSNSSITVHSGDFSISSGDDAFHADDTLTVVAGNISVTNSYEGLEGLHINISGGSIDLVSSDDGLNAAGGTDASGFGGDRGNDRFGGMSGNSDGTITISGGTLSITACGDGIDANGSLSITGGFTTVCGPTQGDTATLDYDLSATISGGTFIGTGSSMMAQTFSDQSQGVIAVSVGGSMPAGTQITLTDGAGNVIIDYAPELSFAVVILSSPELVSGEQYTLTVGELSQTFAAS